jgi:tetratricopeptide (TPR) repeat protein
MEANRVEPLTSLTSAITMNRRERRTNKSKERVRALSPTAQCEAGHRLLLSGRPLEAQLCCESALESNPVHAGALHLMGMIAFQNEEYDHALQWIAQAIAQEARPEFITNLGATLLKLGRHEEALKAFDKAVQVEPNNAALWKTMGEALLKLNRHDHALLSMQHALKLDPKNQDAAYKIGLMFNKEGQFAEAVASLNICDRLLPNHVPTLRARAIVLLSLKEYDRALADNLAANALEPNHADTLNEIGVCLHSLGREEEALVWFDRALERKPGTLRTLNNRAFILSQLQRFTEAINTYDHIRSLYPDDQTMVWQMGLLHMLFGDFEQGWVGREARRTIPDPMPYPKFSQPMWLGQESIRGKTILIRVDEGLGDTIQFIRYVPMVAARGARVILQVERALVSILANFPGVSQCLAISGDPLPDFDTHCPLASLPMVFATRLDTIPAETCYLPLPPEARVREWNERLGPHNRLRVGLVWSGNRAHRNDHNRSTSLRVLSRILDVDATFVSLQKDPRPSDQADLDGSNIIDWTAELNDLADTAALVQCLDLVITVDTSVAHLAAALGRPTWILLPWTPDYRWLLNRDDSPWYPTVRLFRQDKSRDYAQVIDRVRDELVKFARSNMPPHGQ